MIDSGCAPLGFVDTAFAQSCSFTLVPLAKTRTLRLADGTVGGVVSHEVVISHQVGGIDETLRLYVWPLDGPDMILGLPWLRRHNPPIDWTAGTLLLGGRTVYERSTLLPPPPSKSTEPDPDPDPDPDTISPEILDDLDSIDIRSLRATNFTTFAKMKDIEHDAMSLQKFIAMTDDLRTEVSAMSVCGANTTEAPDLRSSDSIALDTPNAVLRRILTGDAEDEDLSPRLRAFQEWVAKEPWLRAVTDDDIQKYIDGKPPLKMDEILAKLPLEYHDLVDAFLPKNAETLPPHRPFDHKIDLVPGTTPPSARARPMSPKELLAIRKYLDEHLDKGFIRASSSPAAAPILMAKKPGGGIRICVDYRGLNNMTIKNRYPIPLIRETLDALSQAKIYTKLDITAAFNRLRIAEGDEWKTAFITRFGLFECLVANFGMTGAPSSFQHYINHNLFDILDKYVTAYLDDILIYSKSRKEHRQHVREVLSRLLAAGLTIDIKKCEFSVTETRYLGLIISTTGIKMDPEKVAAIQKWSLPRTLKDLQRFVGFSNYYRRFIKGYSKIARPLTALQSRQSFKPGLTPEAIAAFDALKDAFSTAPILAFYDPKKKTSIEVDASDWASGGVLHQADEAGVRHPVAFFSSKHSAAECNYEIYDKELLAIVKAFEEWRPELQGCEDVVEVITDHKNLQHFATTKILNQRQVRWSEFLSDFRFQISYRPGKRAVVPDALSRLPGDKPAHAGDTTDDRIANRERILLPPEVWADDSDLTSAWSRAVHLCGAETEETMDDLLDRAYRDSPVAQDIIAAIEDPNCRRFPRKIRKELRTAMVDCQVLRGRVYVGERVFVPPDDAVRLQIMQRTHASASGGHPGRYKTYDLVRRAYFWPHMSRTIAQFVKGCHLCQRTKSARGSPPGFLDPLPVPFRPWTDVSVDYVGPLPECDFNGVVCTNILVVVDRLTKMRHFIPVHDMTATTLAEAFIANVYRLHGTPEHVVSDRGTQFVSAFWTELSRLLGITLNSSTAYHPETDGQTEIVNASIEQYLRAFCTFFQDDWAYHLSLGEFAANNHTSETTGLSPFFANYGFNPSMGSEPLRPVDPALARQYRDEFLNAQNVSDRITRVVSRARAFMAEAQERYADYANAKREDSVIFEVGDAVWLSTEHLNLGRPVKKFAEKWIGPYKVTKVYRRAVALDLPREFKVFPVFHVRKVRPTSPGLPGQEVLNAEYRNRAEGVVVTEGSQGQETRYTFDSIMDSRMRKGTLEYKIKWSHPHRPSWQPSENVAGCDDRIADFHTRFPRKPGPPSWWEPSPAFTSKIPATRRSTHRSRS